MIHPFAVAISITNSPAPKKPVDSIFGLDWFYYWTDLACWKAMKADCITFGVYED